MCKRSGPCGLDAENTHYYLLVASNNTKTKLQILFIWHNILTRATRGQQKLVDCRTISTPALVDTPGKNVPSPASKTGRSKYSELRSRVNREVGPGSHSLSHSSPVPNKPYGFCGRKAPWKKKSQNTLTLKDLQSKRWMKKIPLL